MAQHQHDNSRRRFVRNGLYALATVPAGSLLAGCALGRPEVSMDGAVGKALNYHEDARKVHRGGRQEGAFCRNCRHYAGKPGTQWGGCGAIPGNELVSANGWCMAYVAAS